MKKKTRITHIHVFCRLSTGMMIAGLLLLGGCDKKPEAQEARISVVKPQQQNNEPVALRVVLNAVNMRDEPGMNSKVIAKLAAGEAVTWLGQISRISSPVKLRGIRYADPWVHVATAEGEKGWIYGAALDVVNTTASSKTFMGELMNRRVDGFFGAELAGQIRQYQSDYVKAASSEEMAKVFSDGQALRKRLVDVLEKRADAGIQPQPDMRWLGALLPGYHHAIVAEGTRYYLFADFNTLLEKAKQTAGTEDEAFMELNLAMFANGRESFFPAWIEQTWDYGGESLLGQGIHSKLLEKMDSFVNQTSLFSPLISDMKTRLVRDITGQQVKFRETPDKWKRELQQIINAKYRVLGGNDLEALKSRLEKS